MLRYRDWRRVIQEYVGGRLHVSADDPFPLMVGHVGLALAQAAYESWLADPRPVTPRRSQA